MKFENQTKVGKCKDWLCTQLLLDHGECLRLWRPAEAALTKIISDRSHDTAELRHKAPVERSQPMKTVNLCNCCWSWPTLDSRYFPWIHGKALVRDEIAKELDLCRTKLALLQCSKELISPQDHEDFLEMPDMSCNRATKNQNIVEVDDNEFYNKRADSLVHHTQKRTWSIG